MANLLIIAIGAILINNFVLSRFLGLCPFIGVSKKTETAIGMGMAVVFVMVLASAVTWVIWTYLLSPGESNLFWIIARACGSEASAQSFDLRFLETIAFILVIASLVQFVELVLKKISPALYDALGIFLPLITTNCAILGVAELNTMSLNYGFIEAVVHGFAAGIGFTLALIMMSGIRERLEFAPVPHFMKGLPIAFIVSGLMSMAFLGFSGLKF
ncbi:electron transport complex subunit RsxA [bacterium]|nr:electron transport complex subunit RsxA [bacterium]